MRGTVCLDKEDLKDLSRKELVDVVYKMMEDQNGQPKRRPLPEEVRKERARIRRQNKIFRTVLSTIGTLTVVAAVAVLLSTFLFPVIQVSGDSMEPTLYDGDVLVLLNSKDYECGQLCCVAWQNKLLIKRVIGLPGDYIDINQDGEVFINGNKLDEPYVTEQSLGECDIKFPYQVPDGKVFVMGDRRSSSIDSRSTAIGSVENDQIIGRVLFKVWPIRAKDNK